MLGFAVLIPWWPAPADLEGVGPSGLLAATLAGPGFDTVYAMADRSDDARLGVRSALSLVSGPCQWWGFVMRWPGCC